MSASGIEFRIVISEVDEIRGNSLLLSSIEMVDSSFLTLIEIEVKASDVRRKE